MSLRPLDLSELGWGDERGWGLRPLEALPVDRARVGDVHVVSLRPGAVRGNHVHDRGTEWLLICGGPAVAAWRAENGEVGRMELPGDAPYLLEIPPGVPHAVKNVAGHVLHLVAFNDDEDFPTRAVEPLLRGGRGGA